MSFHGKNSGSARLVLLAAAALAAESALLTLAGWQWRRMHQRQAEMASQAAQPTVTLSGMFDASRTVVLDNQPHPHNPDIIGWRLITPLRTASGTILADRGWLPLPPDRTAAPDLTPYLAPGGEVSLTGILKPIPTRHGWLQGPDTTTQPTILARLSPAAITPETVSASYLQLTQPAEEPQPGLLTQLLAAPSPTPDPARHLSYALQWLGMALAFPVLCLAAWRKSRKA